MGHLEEIFGGKDPIFDVQMRGQAHMLGGLFLRNLVFFVRWRVRHLK